MSRNAERATLADGRGPRWAQAGLIILVGFQLRSVIVGVSPTLPSLRGDLHLSFAGVGTLTAVPVLCLGAASVPGAMLVNRFGARSVVGFASVILGAAAFLRLAPPIPYSLFAWTVVLSVAVAVAQPGLAVSIRNWFPANIQQVSSLYAMALSLGALGGSALTVFLLAIAGWQGTFVIWAGLALTAGVVWLMAAPGRALNTAPVPHGLAGLIKDRQVWHVAGLFGSQSLVFYCGLTWIPFVLHDQSRSYLALVLFMFQVTSLPLIGLVALLRRPWALSRSWYVAGSLLMAIASIALMLGVKSTAWLWAGMLGLGSGVVLVGSIALPAMLAKDAHHVAGYTALTFTAGYAMAFLGPLLGGVLFDKTHLVTSTLWVVTAVALISIGLGATLPRLNPSLPTQGGTGPVGGAAIGAPAR